MRAKPNCERSGSLQNLLEELRPPSGPGALTLPVGRSSVDGCPWPTLVATGRGRTHRPITDPTLQIVPSLMAFTLGGMAIFLALSGRRFVDALREMEMKTRCSWRS